MSLIKSKINSLGWLNSAISVSVVGGVILSSTSVLAATLIPLFPENETSVEFLVEENTFGNSQPTLYYNGNYWKGAINITDYNGPASDELVIRVYFQHIHNPHPGESDPGGLLNLDFRSASSSANSVEFDIDSSSHPGINHSDVVSGILTVNKFRSSDATGIKDWSLLVRADHNVPEPGTILSAAVALGLGGWLKRKNLIK